MRIEGYILCLFLLPLSVSGQIPDISCQISSSKNIYKVGETPIITIRIRNATDSTLQLVKIPDGSESRMRFPYIYYTVHRMSGSVSQAVNPPRMLRCGNVDGIHTEDFVAVEPGQIFNPLKNQSQVYSSGISLAGWIKKKGRYKIVFHYSANQSDFKQWMGDIAWYWFDGETQQILPDKQVAYKKLVALFSKVPKTDASSNEILLYFQ